MEKKKVYGTYDVSKEWFLEQLAEGRTRHFMCQVLGTNYETMNRLLKKHGIYHLFLKAYKDKLKEKKYTISKTVFLELLVDGYKITNQTLKSLKQEGFSGDKLEFLTGFVNFSYPEKNLISSLEKEYESKLIENYSEQFLSSKDFTSSNNDKEFDKEYSLYQDELKNKLKEYKKDLILFTDSEKQLILKHVERYQSPKMTRAELKSHLNLDDSILGDYIDTYQLKRHIRNNEQERADMPIVKEIAEKIKQGMSVQKIADEKGLKQHQMGYFVRKYGLNSEELMGSRKRPSKRKGTKRKGTKKITHSHSQSESAVNN